MTVNINSARLMPCISGAPENTGARVDAGDRTLWVCRADNCLAWRWSAPEREEMRVYTGTEDGKHLESIYGSSFWRFRGELWSYEYTTVDQRGEYHLLWRNIEGASRRGYCGLAGKPE